MTKQANPKCLNLDRITFARSAGWIVRIHPGEMAWAPNEAGLAVQPDPVGGAVDISEADTFENIAKRTPRMIHFKIVERDWICGAGRAKSFKVFTAYCKPEWS